MTGWERIASWVSVPTAGLRSLAISFVVKKNGYLRDLRGVSWTELEDQLKEMAKDSG